MRRQSLHIVGVISCLLVGATVLVGCAARPYVPDGATHVASGVTPGGVVNVPVGTDEVYFVQRGPITRSVVRFKVGPTTQPTDVPVLMLLGSDKRPVDVYITKK